MKHQVAILDDGRSLVVDRANPEKLWIGDAPLRKGATVTIGGSTFILDYQPYDSLVEDKDQDSYVLHGDQMRLIEYGYDYVNRVYYYANWIQIAWWDEEGEFEIYHFSGEILLSGRN